MSSPKVIVQIFLTGSRILGKAFLEAGRQAVRNAKHSPQAAMGSDVAGVGNATSGSLTDQLTRQHRMTLDEAHLILNVKRGEQMEQVLKHYEHLFNANAPATPVAKPAAPRGRQSYIPQNSHYLQSKVVRARERIEAELQHPEPRPADPPQPTSTPDSSTSSGH